MKRLLVLILVAFILGTICWVGGIKAADYFEGAPDPQTESPYMPTPFEEYLINWELGEDIIPYPFADNRFDCDDATLYSYLYLKGLYRDLDIRIVAGTAWYAPTRQHVWLLVSDNQTTVVYDWGIAIEYVDLYQGREISYGRLIRCAEKDL